MNKERLYISYIKSRKEVRAKVYDRLGAYKLSSSWQDILVSLFNENNFKRTFINGVMCIEYKDIIIQIEDWEKCAAAPLINKYINKTVQLQQEKRLKQVQTFNAAVNARNNSILTKQSTNEVKKPLKVKRNNKALATSLIAGSFILTMLMRNSLTNELKGPADNFNLPPEPASIETDIGDDTTFEVGLDINDLIGDKDQLLYNSNSSLDYEDQSQDPKALTTQIKYGDLIEKMARKCGIDPRIVLGIATQESGNHEYGLKAGSKGGLMQIEISYWRNKEITYYDFDDKETYTIKITDENIQEVENNILIGCALLQNELKTYNYNILLAIQSYNYGYSNMSKVLNETSKNTGLTKVQIINDDKCLDWLDYTDSVDRGDSNYINNVLSWTGYGYNFFEFNCKTENGDIKTCTTLPMESSKAITM